MIIRQFKEDDFFHIVRLLAKTGVEPPTERSDFEGLCIVAEDEGNIVGCIWALVGKFTKAYIDYFAVNPEYKGKHLGSALMKTMDITLKYLGIRRYDFYVEPHNKETLELLERVKKTYKTKRLSDLIFFRRELI